MSFLSKVQTLAVAAVFAAVGFMQPAVAQETENLWKKPSVADVLPEFYNTAKFVTNLQAWAQEEA